MKKVELSPKPISDCKKPLLFKPSFFIIFPSELVITEMPELADLIRGTPFSTDLKIDAARCCFGPVVLPNHASFVTLINIMIFL